MKILLTPFMIISGSGLLLSLIVHLYSLLNMPSPFGKITWFLHLGIFIVWIPAIFVSQNLSKNFKRKEFWKASLRGCPKWMKYITYFFFVYAFFNFIIFMINSNNNDTSSNDFLGFSGHWMAFYSASFSILYSGIHAEKIDSFRKCPNGHHVNPLALYCEECGSKIINNNF